MVVCVAREREAPAVSKLRTHGFCVPEYLRPGRFNPTFSLFASAAMTRATCAIDAITMGMGDILSQMVRTPCVPTQSSAMVRTSSCGMLVTIVSFCTSSTYKLKLVIGTCWCVCSRSLYTVAFYR